MRCTAISNGTTVEYYSRNGKPLDIKGKLDKSIHELASDAHLAIDGELMVWDENRVKFLSRKEGNGILNKANKGTISDEEADRICFVIWDYVPYEYFKLGKWNMEYKYRRNLLKAYVDTYLTDNSKVKFIDTQFVDSLEDARKVFNSYLEKGFEGIILKDPDGIWEDKRSKGLIKFKAELECELIVESIEEGSGKYAGKICSLQCTDKTGKLKVGVGTGLTDDDRDKPFEYYLNKIISVKYNEVIIDSKGEMSLFLPVYVEVRFDKIEPDSF